MKKNKTIVIIAVILLVLLVGYIDPQLLWMEGCVGQIYTDLLFNKFIFLPANETTIYVVE